MTTAALAPLMTAINALLDVDPDTLGDAELHEVVVGLQYQGPTRRGVGADGGALGRAPGMGRRRVAQRRITSRS